MAQEKFDVVIVGLGPVGATLAHLLGMTGIKTLVLDREGAQYHLPRAVHFDDEVMRVFQWVGIADELLPKLRVNAGMKFVGEDGQLLLDWPRPQEESALGWNASWRMHQPDLEELLRTRLETRESVTVRTRCEAFNVDDRGDHVALRYEDMTKGEIHHIKASYVVGCDGARSLIRRYIESGMEDYGFHERWLVIDVLLKADKPELGDHTVQYCNPTQPMTYARGPKNRRRWEIKVAPDADSQKITTEAATWKFLEKWLRPDEAEIERTAVYVFHSLIAEKWRNGRLLIAGDAAHQTPPFMGQGMCAGIRDAANLGWKLAQVIKGQASDILLDSYQSERHPNAREFIETAVRLGGLINAADSETAFRAAMTKPDGSAAMKSIYPALGAGLGSGAHAGQLFGQPRLQDGRRIDDVIGHRFVLVADVNLVQGLRQRSGLGLVTTQDAPDAKAHLDRLGVGAVLLRPDRYILGTANTEQELTVLIDQSDLTIG